MRNLALPKIKALFFFCTITTGSTAQWASTRLFSLIFFFYDCHCQPPSLRGTPLRVFIHRVLSELPHDRRVQQTNKKGGRASASRANRKNQPN
jgi:hypothetical protein